MISWSAEMPTHQETALAFSPHAWSPDAIVMESGDGAGDRAVAPPSPEAQAASALERAVSDAYTLGFDEGRHEGETAERARLRTTLAAAEDGLEALRAGEARWSGMIEENIVALSVAIARHIMEREVSLDHTIVTALVQHALVEFPVDHPVRIRVNPSDLAAIEAQGDGQLAALTSGPDRNALWIGDPRIGIGGCVVEGRDRIVDGRVDTAIERVYRRLAHKHA
jgi:flagellar assembly protein FliH